MISNRQSAILLLVFGMLSALPAAAQSAGGDSMWTVLDVTKAVNGAIEESPQSTELREKAVRRFSECSLVYGGLSTMTSNAETKKNYVEAQRATAAIESQIARPLQSAKRVELEEAGRQTVATILRTVKSEGAREVAPLLKSCKALNDSREVRTALQALLQQ
ncbi:MAG TPA: hypothetical protein VFL62_00745 [Bradyrhizobium sp.]|uniref:hypothetical protein n=1 Tax=Bradyrhizobium sp. TaxID=376 RepID=UPI002D7F2EAC|nr:hypothetical protein [Bradyrhizobium sp.]HET7884727.1 hypothetical protein [Bradyrhizobium sp.]